MLQRPKIRAVVGPDGSPINVNSLPSSDTKRWVPRRKAEVIYGLLGGLLTVEQACQRYSVSVAELVGWHLTIGAHGLKGLRSTHLREYRQNSPKPMCSPENGPTKSKRFGEATDEVGELGVLLTEYNASIPEYESHIASIEAEIEALNRYFKESHRPSSEDIALASLNTRRANLEASIAFLRKEVVSIQDKIKTFRLTSLEIVE